MYKIEDSVGDKGIGYNLVLQSKCACTESSKVFLYHCFTVVSIIAKSATLVMIVDIYIIKSLFYISI